jgi:hypothetical protein
MTASGPEAAVQRTAPNLITQSVPDHPKSVYRCIRLGGRSDVSCNCPTTCWTDLGRSSCGRLGLVRSARLCLPQQLANGLLANWVLSPKAPSNRID